MSRQRSKRLFTLIEIIIAVGLLAMLLYVCTDVLIITLKAKSFSNKAYSDQRTSSVGWHIIYRDLQHALGIYYLDGTIWKGDIIPNNKKKKAKKKKGSKLMRDYTHDVIFEFDSEQQLDDAFLKFVVTRGLTAGAGKTGFKEVSYYLMEGAGEVPGAMLLRTERSWAPATGGEKSVFAEEEEEPDVHADYKKYMVVEGLEEVIVSVYDGEEWKEEWNSGDEGDLPLALRIEYTTLLSKDEEGMPKVVKRYLPIPISNLVLKRPLDDHEI